MVLQLRPIDPVQPVQPVTTTGADVRPPETFGQLLARLRLRSGLSQNGLARQAGVDPAYVNRIERLAGQQDVIPSRRVVLALWAALETTVDNRERLLVAAGYCPEAIYRLGWDGYVRLIRDRLETLGAALTSPPEEWR